MPRDLANDGGYVAPKWTGRMDVKKPALQQKTTE